MAWKWNKCLQSMPFAKSWLHAFVSPGLSATSYILSLQSSVPFIMPPCLFFAQRRCNKGAECSFDHVQERDRWHGTAQPLTHQGSSTTSIQVIKHDSPVPIDPSQPCRFFLQGHCRAGGECRFLHSPTTSSDRQPGLSNTTHPRQKDTITLAHREKDTRGSVLCAFLTRPGGCLKKQCPYLHDRNKVGPGRIPSIGEVSERQEQGPIAATSNDLIDGDAPADHETEEEEDNFVRDIAGASVSFGPLGIVQHNDVTYNADSSSISLTGLGPGTSAEDISMMLARINFDVAESNIRIFHDVSATSAVVRLQAESFAQRFLATSEALPDHVTTTAVQHELSKAIQGTLHLSWHKATRNVWLNFGREHVASRVAQSFNTGHYLCWGQKIGKCSVRSSGGSRGGTNPVAWTVELQGVPASFQEQNVEAAIRRENDRPRHIELSAPNYETSAAEISVIVRNLVERYGPLASFLLQHTPGGKREKATARFEKDSDARAACALDGTKLKALGQGKLTATFFCSTKIKITAAIHKALRPQLETLVASWSDKGLNHSVYQTTGMRFVTLILRGTDTSVVAKATKQVEKLMKGLVLRDSEGLDLWHQSLSRNGAVFSKLLALCMELGAIVIRDKVKRQLRFYGSASDMPVVEADIMELLSQRSQSGKDDTPAEEDSQTPVGSSIAVGTCPICFCDADDPVNTSCGHTYCLECFGDNARAAASQPGDFTGVKCMGSDGACETTFTLDELKSHLSTSIFESMLQSIFDQHVRSHATELRFCPTPDCGYTYRCKTTSDCGNYICSNCCEPICRACHARHDDMTCADYQDMASGGHAALARLKKELNIKDCPSCTTPMEKTEGCNHMTCRGCGKHICWVCLAVFEASGPCYEHMRATHGGIGLDHLAG